MGDGEAKQSVAITCGVCGISEACSVRRPVNVVNQDACVLWGEEREELTRSEVHTR